MFAPLSGISSSPLYFSVVNGEGVVEAMLLWRCALRRGERSGEVI